MLVTKKEVKQASKKLLSMLLAVVMLVSTMSVCFGTFTKASAAFEDDFPAYTKDAATYLSESLEGSVIQGIINATDIGNNGSAKDGIPRYYTTDISFTNYADYIVARDTIIYIHKLIVKSEIFKRITSTKDDPALDSNGTCLTFTNLKPALISAIEEKKGSALSSGAKEFIDYLLKDDHAVKHSDKSTSKVNGTVTNTINLTVNDYKGYLATVTGDYKNVGSYDTAFTYFLKMVGKDGSTNLSYQLQTGTNSCTGAAEFTTYYHHFFWNNETSNPEKNLPKATTSDTAKTTVRKYATDVDSFIATNTFDSMASMTLEDIEDLRDDIDELTNDIKVYIAGEGELDKQESMYKQFYRGYADKINAWKNTASDAESIATFSETVNEMVDYMNSNKDYGTFNWGGFDEATIKADYKDFTTTYASVLNNTTVYNYFVNQGIIDSNYVVNFRDNVVAYNLEDTKELADELYSKYAIAHPDLDGAEIPLTEKSIAYGLLTGYINSYNTYTTQVKNAIFTNGIEEYVRLQENLECQVSDCIIYFAENVTKDYTAAKTDAVIAEIETAKNNLASLNNLKNSVDYASNLPLLDTPFANAETFIAYLYSLLGARFTAQVDNADAAYEDIGRPSGSLTLEQFSKVNGALSAIEPKILDFINAEGKGSVITQETRDKYDNLKSAVMPAYESFKYDRGFDSFTTSDILIRREDSTDEYIRVNEDLDSDGIGEYEVTDENVMEIINLLEAALKDPTVAKLLGDLINKDENGEPTGEAFDLSALLNGLLEVIYSDDLLNTIISFIYPVIGRAFADVWAGLPYNFTTVVPDAALGSDADVVATLDLYDVDTAIANVGITLSPSKLADKLNKDATYKTKYSNVIKDLYSVSIATGFDADGNYIDPWKDANLYTTKVDAKTGESKEVYKLVWGITDRASFIDAACAALSGLEPLLYALLLNQPFVNANTSGDDRVRGCKIGTNGPNSTATVTLLNQPIECDLILDPITLMFQVSANDGYGNVLVPIFEALGLKNIPTTSSMKTTKDFLEKGLFAMIDQLIAKVAADPIETILGAVPNLIYAIEADLVAPLLDLLAIEIYYEADAAYAAYIPSSLAGIASIAGVSSPIKGSVAAAMKAEEDLDGDGVKEPNPIKINVGEMLDLESMGINLSSGLKGILDMVGFELPEIDTVFLAKAGKLELVDSQRTKKTYTYGGDKVVNIKANKEDVLVYLVKYVLANINELLSIFGFEVSGEVVEAILANVSTNSGDAVAAIVELLNQKEYDAKTYTWYNGYIDGESVTGNSAIEIYRDVNNDWNSSKSQYLYENIDTILTEILKVAGADFDLGATIKSAVDGILTDKTLTALAGILAKLDLNTLLNEGKTEEELANALDVNALIKQYLGLDLASVAALYAPIAAELEADPKYVHNFGVDSGDKTFAAVLTEMLAPLSVVLDYLLADGNITLTIGNKTVTLFGADGYNNAIIPLLEALGCTVVADPENVLEAVINALVNRVDALATGDVIKNIIDLIPGVLYFITSNGLSTTVINLLQPILVIVDTIRPVFDVMKLINGIEIGDEGAKQTIAELLGGEINLKKLDVGFIFDILPNFIDLDIAALESVIYDVVNYLGTEYVSESAVANTVNGKAIKGAYSDSFTQGDFLTILLAFVLEWASVEENAKALDEMLNTNGIVSSLGTVFGPSEIEYAIPNWTYAAADNDTLELIEYAIEYPNNWTEESAIYIAKNVVEIGNMVAGFIDSNYATLGELLTDKVNIYTPGLLESIQTALGDLIGGLDADLANLVNVGLGAANELLSADVQGLLDYDVSGVNDKASFIAALTGMLMEVEGLVDWLLFGEDYKFFINSNREDIISITGAHGYSEGLALIFEALGVENLPEADATNTEAVIKDILTAVFDRVDAIFADPLSKVFGIIPNVIYFINANGLGVAVKNLLAGVNALLVKLESFGIKLDIESLVDFSKILGVETNLSLYNIVMADVVPVVAELTGLNLDKVDDVLVGFALGEIATYDSLSSNAQYKMSYKTEFDVHDMITVLATIAIMTLTDEANAAKVEELLGKNIYQLVLNLVNMGEVPVQEFNWAFTDREGETFSVLGGQASDGTILEGSTEIPFEYGPLYTKEMEQHISDNFALFVNNIIYLLGLDLNGDGEVETKLAEVINGLLGGSLYNSSIVITIRDALAGVLENLTKLEVNGVVVGGHIAEILKATKIADINAVAEVEVPEFTEDRDKFVKYLCEILEPLYGILKYLLADENLTFFVNTGKTDAITLKGAEGYAFGIIPLLEAIGCENIMTPYEYYAAIKDGKEEVLITSILNPLFDRVDVIIENPAVEILDMLTNILYFINSNGVDTVVKNTLNAVYTLLSAIEPITKIDLYTIIGFDFATINADWLIDKLLDTIANLGYSFEKEDINFISELTVGELKSYTSVNGKEAYRMEYAAEGEYGTKEEMVTVILRLAILFLGHDKNQELIIDLLKNELGMSSEIEPYVKAIIDTICETITETHIGTDTALATVYYVFYGLDTGVDEVRIGIDDINNSWKNLLKDLGKTDDPNEATIGNLIAEFLEGDLFGDIFEDIIDTEEGIAPNGFIKFFAKIVEWFKSIAEWFKNIKLFGKAK